MSERLHKTLKYLMLLSLLFQSFFIAKSLTLKPWWHCYPTYPTNTTFLDICPKFDCTGESGNHKSCLDLK